MNEYEYDTEDPGMRDALERARGQARPAGDDWEATLENLRQTWEPGEAESTTPGPAAEEQPSKETGDEQGAEMRMHDETPDESFSKFPGKTREPTAPPLPIGDPPPVPPNEPWALIKHGLRENQTRKPGASPLEAQMHEAGWAPTEHSPGEKPTSWEALQEKVRADAERPPPPPVEAPPQDNSAAELLQKVNATEQEQAARKPPPPPPAPPPEPGPDWNAMLAQLQEAERSSDVDANVGAMLHAAAPGFVPPPGAGKGQIAAARAAFDAEHQKREEQAQKVREAQTLLEQHGKAALDDPKSPESQRARDAFIQQFPESAKIMKLDGLSANELQGLSQREVQVEHYRATAATEKAKAAEKEAADKAKAAEKEAADKAKQAEKDKNSAAEEKSLADERALLLADPRAKKLGLKPEMLAGLDRKGLDGFRHQLDSVKQDKPGGGVHAPAKPVHGLADIPDPGDRAKVQAIGEGRADITIAGLKDRGRIASLVVQAYPDFDQTKFGAYKSVVQHQATDKDIVAAATAQEHIKQARAHIPANYGPTMLNRIRQAVLSGSGSPEMTPFEVDVKVAADEYAKALGNNAQSGRQEVEHLIAAAQSPEQLATALDEIDHLLATKQDQWKQQLQKVAPKGGATPAEKPALKTRPTKAGGTAYSKDGKRWFTTAEEAEGS